MIIQKGLEDFEARLFVNTDLFPKTEIESLVDGIEKRFIEPLDCDGTIVVYHTETP